MYIYRLLGHAKNVVGPLRQNGRRAAVCCRSRRAERLTPTIPRSCRRFSIVFSRRCGACSWQFRRVRTRDDRGSWFYRAWRCCSGKMEAYVGANFCARFWFNARTPVFRGTARGIGRYSTTILDSFTLRLDGHSGSLCSRVNLSSGCWNPIQNDRTVTFVGSGASLNHQPLSNVRKSARPIKFQHGQNKLTQSKVSDIENPWWFAQ